MGEIADMMLEGLLDEETGEYIGDLNKKRFGEEAPGFPVSYEREGRERGKREKQPPPQPNPNKTNCPLCGRRVKLKGLANHYKDYHKQTYKEDGA